MEINREMLLQSFRIETEECLAQMEQSLLALETQPDDRALIDSLFRAAHTIKGKRRKSSPQARKIERAPCRDDRRA